MCHVKLFLLPLTFAIFILIMDVESCSNFMHFYHFDVNYTCNSEDISAVILFKQPFNGTVFAKNFYANPKCSSPNMYVKPSSEIQLELPLLGCGTKVRRSRGRLPRIRNTLVIQYNPILKSVNDSEIIMTCSPCEPLPSEFWELYIQRDRSLKPRLNIRMMFEPGRNVFSEGIAGMLRVSNEMFLVIKVEHNYEYNDFNVRKCWAHNESIVNVNTSVVLLSEMKACKRSLLDNITLERKNNELMKFTRVYNFNIVAKGNLYVSCALDFCKETCPNMCLSDLESQYFNQWSSVGTHKVFKRSTDESESKRNEVETGNDLLKSRVRALAERFLKLKKQLNANKNSDSQKILFRSLAETPIEKDNEITEDSYIENVKSETDFTRRNIRSQEWLNSVKHDSKELLQVPLSTETVPHVTTDLNSNCSENSCQTSDDAFTTEMIENSNLAKASTEIAIRINHTYSSDKESEVNNTSSDSNSTAEIFETISQQSTTSADCIPRLKFITVTVTLSLLTIFMFLICIAVLLHSRKESKRQKLDSYFLFSSF